MKKRCLGSRHEISEKFPWHEQNRWLEKYGSFDMSGRTGDVEVIKCSLTSFGHLQTMGDNEMTRSVCKSKTDAVGVRGRRDAK